MEILLSFFDRHEAIISFALGLAVSGIVSLINKAYLAFNFWKFKKLIRHEYIDKANEVQKLDILTLGKLVETLTFLRDNEIKYISTKDQFKYIRLIEFARSYIQLLIELAKSYGFRTPYDKKKEEHELIKYNEAREIINQRYTEKLSQYIGLKVDSMLTEEERAQLKKSIIDA